MDELADRKECEGRESSVPFKNLIPLVEIIAEYEKLLEKVGPELFILIDAPLQKISAASGGKIAEAVKRVREGRVNIRLGYDGEYGKISIWGEGEKTEEPKKTGKSFLKN